jgi:hypothetical protein
MALPGATMTMYSVMSATLADDGMYDVQVTNSGGTTTSNTVRVTVTSPGADAGMDSGSDAESSPDVPEGDVEIPTFDVQQPDVFVPPRDSENGGGVAPTVGTCGCRVVAVGGAARGLAGMVFAAAALIHARRRRR